jgi:hypothetical protein
MKPSEVHITAIEQVERSGFQKQFVQKVDIVDLAPSHINTGRNAAAHVQQRVQLYRTLAAAKLAPGKQRQTQIDGGRVESVNSLGQFDSERIVVVQLAGHANQHLSKVAVNTPVATLVGIGERRARNATSKTHVIKPGLLSAQAGFDVAETGAIGQLSKSQTKELIPAREIFDVMIAVVAIDAQLKLVGGNELHELSENGSARVQGLPPKQRREQPYGVEKEAKI